MATSADSQEDEIYQNSIAISWEFKSGKKYEKEKLLEIYSSLCALLNNNGGVVTLLLEHGEINDAKNLERRIYQRFAEILGFACSRDVINQKSLSGCEIVFEVAGISCLCTMHYNMYVPTETQTVPLHSVEEIKKILKPKRIIERDDLAKADNYEKDLVLGKPLIDDQLGLETKKTQYKLVKAEKSKHTTLGDRITENKFASYVSAFANHLGGHIYYGVDDDGIIRGETVVHKSEIIRKVHKAMDKVIYPSNNEVDGVLKPIKGKHWDIFFVPVKSEIGRKINKTFVIVVYISFYNEGVFAQEPESYHIVDGKVGKMLFKEWKKRFLQAASTIHAVARSNFATTKSHKVYYEIMEKMMDFRNQGKVSVFKAYVRHVNKKYATVYVQLSTLSQDATYAFRMGDFELAEQLIQTYDRLESKCEENMLVPGSMGRYIKSANKRAQGEYQESYELAMHGLQMADGLTPGLIQAWFCTHIALLANILANKEQANSERRSELVMESKRLLGNALDYSNHVKASNRYIQAVVDLQQKIYIHLSDLYLGLSLSGSLAPSISVSTDDVSSAKNCLSMVAQLEKEGHELSPLRNVQFLLSLSALFLRQSQQVDGARRDYLKESSENCDKALQLATDNEFEEMVRYCRQLKVLIVE